MTSKTVTMKTVEYDRMIAGENALREEIMNREREFARAIAQQGEWLAKAHAEIDRLTGVAWEHGNRADAAEEEIERLRKALRDVIFDLHNCEYGGDLPRCAHIGDALMLARNAGPYGPPRAQDQSV